MSTYSISQDLLDKIFIEFINSNNIKNSINKDYISHILLKDLPENSKENIIHLLLNNEYYEALNVGDHFKVKPINYDASRYYEPDVLRDMGLSDNENNVYGYVVGDLSWSPSDYNFLCSYLKVILYYHDSDLQIKEHAATLKPLELIKINKLEIPYFKDK
jgi:hypothetical protein